MTDITRWTDAMIDAYLDAGRHEYRALDCEKLTFKQASFVYAALHNGAELPESARACCKRAEPTNVGFDYEGAIMARQEKYLDGHSDV